MNYTTYSSDFALLEKIAFRNALVDLEFDLPNAGMTEEEAEALGNNLNDSWLSDLKAPMPRIRARQPRRRMLCDLAFRMARLRKAADNTLNVIAGLPIAPAARRELALPFVAITDRAERLWRQAQGSAK